jgi:hypothetical protein
MPEFMLLSNSYSPGRGALEHALDPVPATIHRPPDRPRASQN